MKSLNQRIEDVLDTYILSSSGWRHIFAADGESESPGGDITDTDSLIVAAAADAFLRLLSMSTGKTNKGLSVLIARDTRPTGPAIAGTLITLLTARGVQTAYTDIAAAPEVMAYSELSGLYDGFIYITASHNPRGYNGLKFGLAGSVLDPENSAQLIDLFYGLIKDASSLSELNPLLEGGERLVTDRIISEAAAVKEQALEAYRMFTGSVAAGSLYICGQDQIYNTIRSFAEHSGLGVLADFNGSSRSVSIDEQLLESIGLAFRKINDTPGVFAHRIVPEGESLQQCRAALEEAYAEDPSFLFGYVPDCDGDRGNIVFIREETGSAEILEAQQVFALCVLSELAFISLREVGRPLAVVVNGPTSMRVDSIASCFGAEIHRAEVGEANAVALAEKLRGRGYEVRILGEGSNGGNITHPARVRDPLNTIISLLKLISMRGQQADESGLFENWCRVSEQNSLYGEHFTLADVLASMPQYITTSAYEDRAVMHIASTDQEALKQRYEQLFAVYWRDHRRFFTELGITSWRQFNTAGIREIEGTGPDSRPDSSTGGLKIAFYDASGEMSDYIWLRGSKTEPVLRILADCRGADRKRETMLLALQRKLIEQADA